MNKKIILVCDSQTNKTDQAKKLINFGQNLYSYLKDEIILIVFNEKNTEEFSKKINFGNILNIKTKTNEFGDIISGLEKLIEKTDFSYLCFDSSIKSLEEASYLAGKFNFPIITNVLKIVDKNQFSRMIFNSKLEATVKNLKESAVLTISGTNFDKNDSLFTKNNIEEVEVSTGNSNIKIIETMARSESSSLDNAKIILSVGRGLNSSEEIEKVFEVSKLIPGSAVGCSRPIVDQGLLEYQRQVGITGRSVSPKVYTAFGISGSTQHIFGMRDSEFIISVNNDPHASIFGHSDICIVEDAVLFLEALKKELED
ncbi:MAG: electron transfer flavoprotein subunit alpha/FixB family protein [Desulfobacteraceae bacterium]|nr:electron transfer flavoprotein subunit alpha/FixB family protein [Desulfobacteraceae bacterium]